MKNKNTFFSALLKLIVFVVFFLFFYFDIFQKLDFRLYDALMKLRKEPQVNEKIVLTKIDDASILALGEWPWSRDVIADTLIRLKELGADTAIFDIEYISPSKNGIAPSAENKIFTKIHESNGEINDLLSELSSGIDSGYFTLKDIQNLTKDLKNDYIPPIFNNLFDYVNNNISRDNDEYFAQALQFFGKAYLTINHQDLGYITTDEEIQYISNRILFSNVTDDGELVPIGNKKTSKDANEEGGFVPALNKLMTRAYGANFTNSVVDSDGTRRRMEILYKYKDKYICQLTFGPYMNIVDSHEIIREKNKYIIKNAKDLKTGERKDITIPVDDYGRMFINYTKGSCEDSFNNFSIIDVINLDNFEKDIINCLYYLGDGYVSDNNGSLMDYSLHANELLSQYDEITQFKEYLLAKCTGYDNKNNVIDGISEDEYEQYFGARNDFYNNIKDYIDANYLPSIKNRLEELRSIAGDEIIDSYILDHTDVLNSLSLLYKDYQTFHKELSELLNGAYCIIGNTATSTTDNGATPFEKKYVNVGIHANILNTLIGENFIVYVNWLWGFAFAVLLAFLMLTLSKLSNAKQNVITFICYFIYCAVWGAMFVFNKYYIRFIGTIFYLAADLIIGFAFRFYESNKEKQFITQIAASFANKDTVEELRKNPEAFKTEGQKKCITALFSDIQKFSTLSESIGRMYGAEGPNKLIEILNEYLGKMSNEILRNSGTIDKYEGDAIISMFGAPDSMNTHTKEEWAYLCLNSAIKMKQVEVEFNQMHSEMFKPTEITNAEGKSEIIQLKPLQTRIGVNSGEAFVGLMGSKTDSFSKLNYTMIGDTVNLASRLEGVNKAYNSWIMCSGETWGMANKGIHKDELLARKLDRVRVVGRSTPVQLYNILGFNNELGKDVKEQVDIFNTALEKYFERDFKNAGKLFMQANQIGAGDPTSLVFAERCKNFIENGVPEDWDGVINMTSK